MREGPANLQSSDYHLLPVTNFTVTSLCCSINHVFNGFIYVIFRVYNSLDE